MVIVVVMKMRVTVIKPQPFRSMQLVMVDSVRAGELSRTHFRPQGGSWWTPDHVACGGESPEIFC